MARPAFVARALLTWKSVFLQEDPVPSSAPGTSADAALIARLRRAIPSALRGGDASLAAVARFLGTSTRTLQRRLQESGESYTDMVDRVRHELSRDYVREGKLSYDEIAQLLGFSQASAFFRAFRRWTGTTPSAFRG